MCVGQRPTTVPTSAHELRRARFASLGRGLALFLGLFTFLNFIAETRSEGFDLRDPLIFAGRQASAH